MRRVTPEELTFYDRVAERINHVLSSRSCALNQSSLAERIRWNRASLCNFVNRTDKSIAAHFIPRIAYALNVSVEHLICGDPSSSVERTLWDARSDRTAIIVEKLDELRHRKAHCLRITSLLPLVTLVNHAMVANFVDSMVNGAGQTATERWHEMIEAVRQNMKDEPEQETNYIIPYRDLMRLPKRLPPYQGFTDDEVVYLLDNMKKEWVRHHDFRLIALDDSSLTPDIELELASNNSLMVIGNQTQLRCGKDLRIDWDDDPQGVRLSRECLLRLKRSAGFGARENPSAQQAERLIDQLLMSMGPNHRGGLPNSRYRCPVPVPRLHIA